MNVDVAVIPDLMLQAGSGEPLHRQLYEALRRVVLDGRSPPGSRLPPTRELARQLGVSRNTVMAAFEQLSAEGYLEGRVGAGTYISRSLPEDLLHARMPAATARARVRRRPLSARGRLLDSTAVTMPRSGLATPAFRIGTPDTATFPFEAWARIAGALWRQPPPELLRYGDPAGYAPLRRAIAEHYGAARAVRCDADQVIVVSGSQQGLDLAARVLLDPGDEVWIEDPGYLGARAALLAAGARLVPVPVDGDGLAVASGVARARRARAAYVTPSHQFPLGVTMSLSRRLALLEWASDAGAWIIEDDYDSEYRYAGHPLAAMQGLDRAGRVIYVGTFSKVMFPSLRLGYLVVPPDLVDAFVSARAIADRHPPSVEQAMLAEFMERGHFGRHIRRMRALYADRQALLLELARRRLAGMLDVAPCDTGIHVVGWLETGSGDAAAAARAAAQGVDATPLSAYSMEAKRGPALLLGYAAVDARTMADGVRRLEAALGG